MDMEFKYVPFDKGLELAKEIFNFAKRHSAFYSKKFEDIGEIKTYKDWLNIPFLTRDELYNNAFPYSLDMITREIKNMIVISTGGTSGVARYITLTHDEWDKFCEIQAKALHLLGIRENDIVANLFVSGNLWPSFLGAHEILKMLGAVHLPIEARTEGDKMMEFLFTFKPTVILSVPSLLVSLSDMALSMGKVFESVRLIMFAGEHLSKSASSHIKKAFPNTEIKAAAYSSSDCGIMGYQCEYCEAGEYHIPTEFQFIEIFDFEKNRVAEPEEEGEIIITNLHRTAMPLIRYRIGDIGYIKKESCKCGDKNPILVLKGRAGEDFKIASAYVSMGEIERAISSFVSKDGISPNYQVEITEDEKGFVGFILRIESSDIQKSNRHREGIIKSLVDNIQILKMGFDANYFSVFDVKFVPVGSLPRSPITGKIKRLIDRRVN
ncbi:phenylacetate--CoA ligase family protein [Hippea alviniae]|uniref:phenylacetate--CoA ligase family protein n=1 Tax=Hippea alviniae TaxID=1279027 RepID=UPI0003B57EFF|nr:AMP-binding protein [Hippea alviniae]